MSDVKFGISLELIDKATKGLKSFRAQVSKTTTSVLRFSRSVAGSKLSIAGLTAAVTWTIRTAVVQERTLLLLNSAYEQNAGAVKLSREEIILHSRELQKATGVGDELTQRAQGLLLTFRQIQGEAFKKATEAVLDMTVALHNGRVTFEGLKASSIQIGKALQHPLEGLTALRRVGVAFTEDQEQLIKSLAKAGKLELAQAVILRELNAEFKDTAKVLRQGLFGQLTVTQGLFADLQEQVAIGLTGSLRDDLLPAIQDTIIALQSMLTPVNVVNWMATLTTAAKVVGMEFRSSFDVTGMVFNTLIEQIKAGGKVIPLVFKVAMEKAKDIFKDNTEEVAKARADLNVVLSKLNKDNADMELEAAEKREKLENDIQAAITQAAITTFERIEKAEKALAIIKKKRQKEEETRIKAEEEARKKAGLDLDAQLDKEIARLAKLERQYSSFQSSLEGNQTKLVNAIVERIDKGFTEEEAYIDAINTVYDTFIAEDWADIQDDWLKVVKQRLRDEVTETATNLDAQKQAYSDFAKNILDDSASFGEDLNTFVNDLTTALLNGPQGLVTGLESGLKEVFPPQVSAFLSTTVGASITGFVLHLVTAIFGNTPTKTVAEYAEDAFDKMIENTNKALENIGREKTIYEKQLELIDKLIAQGKTNIETQEEAALLGSVLGANLKDVIEKIANKLVVEESKELSEYEKQFLAAMQYYKTILAEVKDKGIPLGSITQALGGAEISDVLPTPIMQPLQTPEEINATNLLWQQQKDALAALVDAYTVIDPIKDKLTQEQIQRVIDIYNIQEEANGLLEKMNAGIVSTLTDLNDILTDLTNEVTDLNEDVAVVQAKPISIEEKREQQESIAEGFKKAIRDLTEELGGVNVLGTASATDDLVKQALADYINSLYITPSSIETSVPVIKISIDGRELNSIITDIKYESVDLNLDGEIQ